MLIVMVLMALAKLMVLMVLMVRMAKMALMMLIVPVIDRLKRRSCGRIVFNTKLAGTNSPLSLKNCPQHRHTLTSRF